MKNITFFIRKVIVFTAVKNGRILHRHVCVIRIKCMSPFSILTATSVASVLSKDSDQTGRPIIMTA